MRIFAPTELIGGVQTTRVLNGFVYNTSTRVLTGIASLNNNGTIGTFTITLATGGLILEPNTWYSIGCSYNTITGEVLWKTSPSAQASGLSQTALWVPGFVPNEIDYVQAVITANATATPPVPANTATSNIVFDNYVARAVATSDLLSATDFVAPAKQSISIYPNPTSNLLNVKNESSETISSVKIIDLNGREVLVKNFNGVNDAQINVANLTSGMYLINITAGDQTTTRKFLKQ